MIRKLTISKPLLPEQRPRNALSRAASLRGLAPGRSLLLDAPLGRVAAFMQQIQADISRLGLSGQFTQSHILGIDPRTREVVDIVRVTRKENPEA